MTPLVLHLPRRRAERLPGLDAARAFAVVAMVVGHTADGLLSDAARALPWVQLYWGFRGLTAPLFLVVSGWAVAEWASRSGLTGWPLLRNRLGRVALLLACGFVLRWPGWDVWGVIRLERPPWQHLLSFDALQCIAWSLLAGAALLAIAPTAAARKWVVAIAAVGIPLASGAVHAAVSALDPPFMIRLALVSDPASPFGLFPWAGYFFAGALAGHLLPLAPSQVLRSAALLVASAALLAITSAIGVDWSSTASPTVFGSRLAQVLAVLGAVTLVPSALSVGLAPIGRASLVVYVAHLPIVYGWSTSHGLVGAWGRTLEPWEVGVLSAFLLALGVALAAAIRWTRSAPRMLQVALAAPTAREEPPAR